VTAEVSDTYLAGMLPDAEVLDVECPGRIRGVELRL
jgi:hypothetical protein